MRWRTVSVRAVAIGWALVACYGGIVASRMERPGVQQRVAGLYHRVRSWLGLNK